MRLVWSWNDAAGFPNEDIPKRECHMTDKAQLQGTILPR